MHFNHYYLRKVPEGRRTERLDLAERWLRDGLETCDIPGGLVSMEIDLSNLAAVVPKGSSRDFTPLFVRAAVLALMKFPQLHQLVGGNDRCYPEHIEIGLSVGGEAFVSAMMIITQAERKTVNELAEEIAGRIPQTRIDDQELHRRLRRWGWIVPFSFLRRWLLRTLRSHIWFRRGGAGTFQVSILPDVDVSMPLRITAPTALSLGAVRERPVVRDGVVVARLTVIASLVIDHSVSDGLSAARFMRELKRIVESSEQLKSEAGGATP